MITAPIKEESPTMSAEFALHTSGNLPDKFSFNSEFEKSIHYMQSVEWYKYHQSSKIVVGTFVGGTLVARSVITKFPAPYGFGSLYRIERGPVSANFSFLRLHLEQLLNEFGKKDILIEISPYDESPDKIKEISEYLNCSNWYNVKSTRTFYKNSVVLDLTPDIDDIKRKFRKGLKHSINKSIKSDLQSKFVSDRPTIEQLLDLYNITAEKKSFKTLSDNDRDFIIDGAKAGTIIVCAVFIENQCVGGVFMITMDSKILVEWRAFSDNEYHRRYPLAHYADWESIKWAKKNGFETYDFAGYWLDRGDDDSINRYKTGFSKQIISVVPEYDYFRSAKCLYMLINLKRLLKNNLDQLLNSRLVLKLSSAFS